jgi:bla regulator protein BlaR1
MIPYLIKSACCAIIFLLLYTGILEKEKMHRFNRVYLLVSVILSFIIPFITIPVSGEALPSMDMAIPILFAETDMREVTRGNIIPSVTETAQFSWQTWLWVLYGTVTGILLLRFGINLYRIAFAYKNSQLICHENVRMVIVKENISSYTFLNTVFLSQRDYTSQSSEILHHEFAHVKQKHWVDIFFIEIIKIVFWFNPVFILYKRSIQLNHEFLADEAVIKQCANVTAYQHLLLDRISMASHLFLSSRFNYSVTKKRLQMMTRKNNRRKALLKKILPVPLFIACFILFGTRSVSSNPPAGSIPMIQDTASKDKKTAGQNTQNIPDVVLAKNTPYTHQGISTDEMSEYKAIEKKYIDKGKSSNENRHSFSKLGPESTDRKRLLELFLRMNRKQQQSAHLYFLTRTAPREKEPPTPQQFERWKNANQYGVWIDDKKVNNKVLDSYKASDFSLYDASKLYGAAKKNVKYQVQVNLMTNSYHAAYYRKGFQEIKDDPYMLVIYWRDDTVQKSAKEAVTEKLRDF